MISLLVFILLAGALGLCSPAQASARPRYGGRARIVWTEPMSLTDPFKTALPSERALSALLFETLFERTSAGLRPLLAEEWHANADSTEWSVTLKRNVEFHDGKPLTADDVVYSIKRILQLSDPCSCRWPLRNLTSVNSVLEAGPGRESQVEGPEAGRSVVWFVFNEPEPDLPLLLSCPGLAVLPYSKSTDRPDTGEIPGTPPGSGPFRIKSGRAQSRLELGANESHHLGRPFLDGLSWEFSPFGEGLVELQAGAAVLLAGIAPPVEAGRSGLPAGTARLVSESAYTLYLACNPSRPALADIDSRLTVLEAVDRASIHRSIIVGSGRIAEALLASGEAPSALWGAERGTIGTGQDGPGETRQGGERQSRNPGGENRQGAGQPRQERNTEEPVGQGQDKAGDPRSPGARSGEVQGSKSRELTFLIPRWHELISDVGDRIQVDLIEAGFSVRVLKMGREELAFKLAEGEFDLFLGLWAPDRWLDDYEWLMYDFWETQLGQAQALKSAVRAATRRRGSGGGGGTGSEGSRAPSLREGGRTGEGNLRSSSTELDRKTQSPDEALPAGDPAAAPRATVPPIELEEILAEEALLLPLFHMDLVIYLRQWLVPGASSTDGVPDLSWSWLRSGGR